MLPDGVSRGTWEYAHTDSVADEYDDYFQFDEQHEFDLQCVRDILAKRSLPDEALLADLGCGTARALIPLLREGNYRGLGVDLSRRMLEVANHKATDEKTSLDVLQANLVELSCIQDESVDFAICLFSTLGMIRGSKHRDRALAHMRRILKPDGTLVFHVHNYWFNLFDPGGPKWLVTNWCRSWWDRDLERGDKYYPYRNVTRMFLHVFTRRELIGSLRRAGFESWRFQSLNQSRQAPLRNPWLLGRIRASGWMIECRR